MCNRIAIEVKSYRKLQSKWNFMNSLNDIPHLLPKLIEQPSPTRSGGPWKLYWKAGDRNREATTDREGRTEGEEGDSKPNRQASQQEEQQQQRQRHQQWLGKGPQHNWLANWSCTSWQELLHPLPSAPPPLPVSVVRLLLIASANNNLCVVSGQKAVSATGNIFSVCFSCLLHYLCSCK